MGVDVVDGRAVGDAGVGERDLDRPDRALAARVGRGDVVGVARRPVAGELGVDLGAARLGVLLALEDQHRRALAHHEAVAPLGEGTARGLGRVVVGGGERLLLHEAADGELDDHRLGAAGHHHVGAAGADKVHRVADRVGRGRAGGGEDVAGALRAERDRHVAGALVGDELGDGERREPVGSLVEEGAERIFSHLEPADAHAEDGGHAVHVGLLLGAEAGVAPSLVGRRHRVLRELRHVPRLALLQEPRAERVLLEALHLRRNLAGAARGVELGYAADAGLAGLHRLPGRVLAVADCCQHADAGDHHFLHFASPCCKSAAPTQRFGHVM